MKKLTKKICLALTSVFLVSSLSVAVGINTSGESVGEENVAGVNPLKLLKENKYLNFTSNVDSPDYVLNGVASSGKKTFTPDDIPAYYHNGIQVDVLAAGTTIEFANTYDISTLTHDVPLLDWMPLPETRGTAEITQATIKVQDADNADNYFCVQFTQNQYDVAIGMTVYTQSFTNLGSRLGVNAAGAYDSNGNIITKTNFTGVTEYALGSHRLLDPSLWGDTQPLGTPFSIRYDAQTKEVVHRVEVLNYKNHILELDDEVDVGIGNGFKGFTNDRVKISLTIDKIGGAGTTSIMLYNVLGQSLGGEILEDKVAPNYFISYPQGKVPKAQVNKPYKLFAAEAYDALCGICESKVYIKEPYADSFVETTGNEFIPTKAGQYILKYESEDSFGNVGYVEIPIDASFSFDPISIEIQDLEKDSYSLGEKIKIPKYELKGGVGATDIEIEVVRSLDGEKIAIKDGEYFLPLIVGQYQINYIATDYVGNTLTQVKPITVEATLQPTIYSKLNVPNVFIDGAKIKLPDVEAYDYYTQKAMQLRAKKEVKIFGDNGTVIEIKDDLLFTPSLETLGSEISIQYKIYCKDYPSHAIVENYEAKIVKGTYAENYFYFPDDNVAVSYNNPNNATERFVRFDAKDVGVDTEISFINPISESNLNFKLEVEYAKKNFEKINVKIFDAENKNIGFEFDISENFETSELLNVDYRGTRYGMNGGFNTINDVALTPIMIKYDNGVVRDYLNSWVFNVTHNADGSEFTGFPSGFVTITFTIVSPSQVMSEDTPFNEIGETDGAALIIESIGGQIFDASYDIYEGTMEEYVDFVAPEISYDYDLSRQLAYGDTFVIPYATASDVISPYVEVFVNVTSPTGQPIFSGEPMRQGLSFNLNEYGYYYIYYYAFDANQNEGFADLNISITDTIAPLICLSSTLSYNVSLNSIVTIEDIPQWSIVDNITKNLDVKIFVVDTCGFYHMLYNSLDDATTYDYKVVKSGTHKIVYVAVDEIGNITCEEVLFQAV